ncbi:hypothetical protein NSK_008315 [Nannochloropsis salina CCMP1776]|uniref:Uncharacterized protein n=1 Tax=Nannochloropsis salina CCMP1776 TaxID=1027361 RepID=A0A4D9CUL1_9STRA|nr:hypothetical protein NSK_008315 [Nannochloropsis salina CCMP1776]|eukprot:TFJ80349.1 hypothetical protein NSK_008315 [Nannochloropsis salina CCMP1776]
MPVLFPSSSFSPSSHPVGLFFFSSPFPPPIFHSGLQEDPEASNACTYLKAIREKLASLPPSSFLPSSSLPREGAGRGEGDGGQSGQGGTAERPISRQKTHSPDSFVARQSHGPQRPRPTLCEDVDEEELQQRVPEEDEYLQSAIGRLEKLIAGEGALDSQGRTGGGRWGKKAHRSHKDGGRKKKARKKRKEEREEGEKKKKKSGKGKEKRKKKKRRGEGEDEGKEEREGKESGKRREEEYSEKKKRRREEMEKG